MCGPSTIILIRFYLLSTSHIGHQRSIGHQKITFLIEHVSINIFACIFYKKLVFFFQTKDYI